MSRGLTDEPISEDENKDQGSSELDAVINELIKGQNKLHDRIIDLERKLDHMTANANANNATPHISKPFPRNWRKGL